MHKIQAPFSGDQVKALNRYQNSGIGHPFTCMSPEISGCEMKIRARGQEGRIGKGILIAKEEGWACPCGEYTRDWAYEFMLEPQSDKVVMDFAQSAAALSLQMTEANQEKDGPNYDKEEE